MKYWGNVALGYRREEVSGDEQLAKMECKYISYSSSIPTVPPPQQHKFKLNLCQLCLKVP